MTNFGGNTIIQSIANGYHTKTLWGCLGYFAIISGVLRFAYFATLLLSFPNIWVPHIGSYNLPRSFEMAREIVFYQLNFDN